MAGGYQSSYSFVARSRQRIAVVEVDGRSREAIGAGIKCEGYEVACFADLPSFIASCATRPPHAVVLNAEVNGVSGIDAVATLKTSYPGLVVVVIEDRVNLASATAAMRLGAADVLAKPIDLEVLLRRLREDLSARSTAGVPRLDLLSEREKEVLRWIVNGSSSREAGARLGISPRTVELHRAHICEKLGARNTADLVRIVVAGAFRGEPGGISEPMTAGDRSRGEPNHPSHGGRRAAERDD